MSVIVPNNKQYLTIYNLQITRNTRKNKTQKEAKKLKEIEMDFFFLKSLEFFIQ